MPLDRSAAAGRPAEGGGEPPFLQASVASLAPPAPGPLGPETTLWEGTPSLKALLTRISSTASFVLLLPLGAYLILPRVLGAVADMSAEVEKSVAERGHDVTMVVTVVVIAAVVFRLARLGWQIASLKAQRYRVSNQRIVIESGVFSRRIEDIDMRTVEDLAFHQSFLERLLEIGTIVVVSADRTAGRYPLVGITRPRETRELVRGAAYQATHRQIFTRQT
jgi:membrane protein YdbS with pleckstrin-like domain